MREATAIPKASALDGYYNELVDIKTVKLRDGASRIENAMYFLEQIKNPCLFRVSDDIVELCFTREESLSDVLVKHFNLLIFPKNKIEFRRNDYGKKMR